MNLLRSICDVVVGIWSEASKADQMLMQRLQSFFYNL